MLIVTLGSLEKVEKVLESTYSKYLIASETVNDAAATNPLSPIIQSCVLITGTTLWVRSNGEQFGKG